MIARAKYKNRDAIVVESDALCATFLPDDGAKIASLIDITTNREALLTRDGESYQILTTDGRYVDSECSAFDDMFPTIDPYTPETGAYQGITYPAHEECCHFPYEARAEEDNLIISAHSRLFPIHYKKTVAPASNGSVNVDYATTNERDAPFDFIWSCHIMLQKKDSMHLLEGRRDKRGIPRQILMPAQPFGFVSRFRCENQNSMISNKENCYE